MKKKIIVIILVLALLIDVQRVSAAENDSEYPATMVIYCVDYRLDIVYITDGYNNFYFKGVEDLYTGDTLSLIMNDNGTPEIKDDIIVDYRYSDLQIQIDGIEYKTIR